MKKKIILSFPICLLRNNEFIGTTGLRVSERFNNAELGFWVGEPFWNQGYVSEAIGEILSFGFKTLGLHKIYAHHFTGNPASGKVMIKNGMIKEGELVDHVRKEGQYLSLVQYRLTEDEFSADHNKKPGKLPPIKL